MHRSVSAQGRNCCRGPFNTRNFDIGDINRSAQAPAKGDWGTAVKGKPCTNISVKRKGRRKPLKRAAHDLSPDELKRRTAALKAAQAAH